FTLTVVEQPRSCRATGFSNSSDRRPIDPTPIVHLLVTEQDQRMDEESLQNPFFVLHASLYSADMSQQCDQPRLERALLGPLVSSASTYKGLDQRPGIYFAFPGLSVRVSGTYRLHFSLMALGRFAKQKHSTSSTRQN
ncbi:velvet factor, partial [Zychaea mexicana]|uniref:velvet factor n=1 Tax=Zychaea mexicana TaxID=64656 RepID=UPI0022FF432E